MDQCTHEVRAEYWGNIIKVCGQRPAGQSAKKWMDENGICEQSYYHWQRKFRQQAYDQMKEKETLPSAAEKTGISFAEIPYSPAVGREGMPGVIEAGREPAAVIWTSTMRIEISNQISESLLAGSCGRCPMLEDAAGIRRVVLACGTVDFRKGLMGCPRNTQEAADLIEEQFHYLMMGLNPLHLKVKEVAPEKYIEMVV